MGRLARTYHRPVPISGASEPPDRTPHRRAVGLLTRAGTGIAVPVKAAGVRTGGWLIHLHGGPDVKLIPMSHRVVVIGGGFGGLRAAKSLAGAPVELTLIDRRNFHLFQPLTYQVATGALSPGEVCYPLREIFKRQENVRVMLAEVTAFDLEERRVEVQPEAGRRHETSVPYDTLIVAGGSRYSYFGHDEWRSNAPEVKSLESALAARARLLSAFEAAEMEPDEQQRRALLTFVVVGAGPTGVEMAGQIAELAKSTL